MANDINRYYDNLESFGLNLGVKPIIGSLTDKKLVREVHYPTLGYTGKDILIQGNESECIEFFRNAVLGSIHKVVSHQDSTSDKMPISFDPLPHNFVNGKYIDFFPVYSEESKPGDRRLDNRKIWTYALVKAARVRPDLFLKFTNELNNFLKNNSYLTQLNYLRNQKWQEGLDLLSNFDKLTNNDQREALVIKFNDLLFLIDPINGRDELLGMLLAVYQLANSDSIETIKAQIGLNLDSNEDNLIELMSYYGKLHQREYRKKISQVAQLIITPHLFTENSIANAQQKLDEIHTKMVDYALYDKDSVILSIGSYARGSINMFSDLDYIFFLGKNNDKPIEELMNHFSIQMTDQISVDLNNMRENKVDRIKVKFSYKGIKVSILVLGNQWIDRCSDGEQYHIIGYKPKKASVHILKDIAGNAISFQNDTYQNTWDISLSGLPLMGKIIDNIVTAVSLKSGLGESLISRTMLSVVGKIKEYNIETTFDNFLKILYRANSNDYSDEALKMLRQRFIGALNTV